MVRLVVSVSIGTARYNVLMSPASVIKQIGLVWLSENRAVRPSMFCGAIRRALPDNRFNGDPHFWYWADFVAKVIWN